MKRFTLKELVNYCNPVEVIDALIELYPEQVKNREGYNKVYATLLDLEPTEKRSMYIEVYHVYHTWDSAELDPEDYIGVHGIDPEAELDEFTGMKGEDIGWAIEYTPWEEWLAMDVVCTCAKDERANTYEKVLAHCLWEMTWAGFDQACVKEQFDEIMERKKSIDDGTAELIPCDDLWDDLGIEKPEDLE